MGQRKCLGLGTHERGDGEYSAYAAAAGLGRGTDDGTNDFYSGSNHDHIGEDSGWDSVTLTYELEDSFGNVADQRTRTVKIADNIAPTLYITQHQIRAANADGTHNYTSADAAGVAHDAITCDDGVCKCLHMDEQWSESDQDGKTKQGDYTTEHCVQNHHVADDGTNYTTYDHIHGDRKAYGKTHLDAQVAGNTGLGMSAYNDELEIQHSAGYAQDYKYVQELMEEGNGYGCYDICSSTTTEVKWVKKACDESDSGSEFNMLKPGTYYLKYTCRDLSDNTATACRTFVNVDKTRPVITVLQAANDNRGVWTVEASRDNNYVDAGATCSDMVDGNISQDVEVSGDVVNMAAVGTYKINYNCEDSAGQKAVQATRTVIVEDTTCPTCTVPGATKTITVEASFPYTEESSTCTDTLDGAMPNAGVYGKVNVEQTGTYVLTYSATDKNGNGRNQKKCAQAHFTKAVVVGDTMVPIISLKYKGNKLMAESTSTVNGWVIGAVASAVSGVALLGYAATRKTAVATSVPV